ncbi:MAG: prepilin-type N-terminal cleavage/methylation domain-containing protein [Elusimicrobiaceae bacterium]
MQASGLKKCGRFIRPSRVAREEGFTLAEMLVASLIFLMISLSLVGVWLSTHKYMISSFRENLIKAKVNYAFRLMKIDLGYASRIDFLSDSVDLTDSSIRHAKWMGIAENVDSDGCFPIYSGAVNWTVYCLAAKGSLYDLYRYTGTTTRAAPQCPSAGVEPLWGKATFNDYGVLPAQCGTGTGGTKLLEGLTSPNFTFTYVKDTEVQFSGEIYRAGTNICAEGDTSCWTGKPLRYQFNRLFNISVNGGDCVLLPNGTCAP